MSCNISVESVFAKKMELVTLFEILLTWYLMSPSLDIVRHHEGERIRDRIISAKSDRD